MHQKICLNEHLFRIRIECEARIGRTSQPSTLASTVSTTLASTSSMNPLLVRSKVKSNLQKKQKASARNRLARKGEAGQTTAKRRENRDTGLWGGQQRSRVGGGALTPTTPLTNLHPE